MIAGNPDKFSIYFDIVEEWSNPSFAEGVFFYIVECKFYPREIPKESSTLNVCLNELMGLINKLSNYSVENESLFYLPKEEAYEKLNSIRFVPYEKYILSGKEEDYTYSISIGEMLSYMDEIYLISSKSKEKILYKEQNSSEIYEAVFEKGYVLSVMKKASKTMEKVLNRDKNKKAV